MLGDGFMCTYICKNLLSCTLELMDFIIRVLKSTKKG